MLSEHHSPQNPPLCSPSPEVLRTSILVGLYGGLITPMIDQLISCIGDEFNPQSLLFSPPQGSKVGTEFPALIT